MLAISVKDVAFHTIKRAEDAGATKKPSLAARLLQYAIQVAGGVVWIHRNYPLME